MQRAYFCLLAGLAFMFIQGAAAAVPRVDSQSFVRVVYGLRVAFLPLGKMELTQRMAPDAYRADSKLETTGIVTIFWKSKIEAHSSGAFERGRIVPSRYDSFSVNHHDKKQKVSLSYVGNGPPKLHAVPPYKTWKFPVADSLKQNTLDPVSALVLMTTGLSANGKNPCGTVAPVFDGARRYDVVLTYRKTERVSVANGLYSGPVFVCQVHYRQIAGFKQKILEEGKKLPDIYAWIASLPARNDSREHYLVPVRIWTTTPFGIVEATAERVNLNGNVWKDQS
ncbi:MAG: DUF3108 domain-containing protein [Alphaproteobacteria bacterium]